MEENLKSVFEPASKVLVDAANTVVQMVQPAVDYVYNDVLAGVPAPTLVIVIATAGLVYLVLDIKDRLTE